MLPHGSNGGYQYPEQYHPSPNSASNVNGNGRTIPVVETPRRQASFEVQLPVVNKQLYAQTSSSSPRPPSSQRPAAKTPKAPKPPSKDNHPGLLITLAENYFGRAHRLGPAAILNTEGPDTQNYYKLIATGLGCLETVLKYAQAPNQRWKLQARIEVCVRLRFATVLFEETENTTLAEDVLHKGIIVAGRNGMLDMKYAMQHLLVRILHKHKPKAAFSMLGTISGDAEAKEAHTWMYSFRLLRATLLTDDARTQDINGAITAVRSIASHAYRRNDMTVYILSVLHEAALHLLSGSQHSDQAQIALQRAAAVPVNSEFPPQLSLFQASLNVLCAIQQGNANLAAQKISELHEFLSPQSLKDWYEAFYVPVNSSRPGFEPDLIVFNWFGKQEVMVLGYFISGMAFYQRSAIDNDKALRFLDEGIKKLDRLISGADAQPISITGVAGKMSWRRIMKCALSMYKCFLLCGRTRWSEAKQLLETIRGYVEELRADKFAAHLFDLFQYLQGTIAQASGDLDNALTYYKSIHSNHTEIGLMATLNAAVILRGDEMRDSKVSDHLLANAEKPCLESKNRQVVASYVLARAVASPELLTSKKYLAQALEHARDVGNNQITLIALAFMAHRFFANIVSEQAEKASRASYVNAKRCHESLWMTVSGEMHADCLARGGDHDGAYNQRLEIAPHKAAVVQNLNKPMPPAEYEQEFQQDLMFNQQYQQPVEQDPHHYYHHEQRY